MLTYTELSKDVFMVREPTDRPNRLNSLLIEDKIGLDSILIDANYPFQYINDLYTRVKTPVKGLYFSHCHLDHTAHAFYQEQNYRAPIYVPIQEKNYILSIESMMESVGFRKLGLNDSYMKMVQRYMKFEECKSVNTFIPGKDVIEYSRGIIETIHIPGHSPGQTAFLIKPNEGRKVLFVSDLGSHPYYGDLNSDLKKYYESIDKMEQLYLSSEFILVPAHGTIYIERDEGFFNRIREKIKDYETKIFNALSKNVPKSIKELVYEGVITPKERMVAFIKDLYLLWDGGRIYHHLNDFIERGLVEKIEELDLVNDKYLLIS